MTQNATPRGGERGAGPLVIAPRVKRLETRRYLWLLLLVPPTAYSIARGVSEIAASERTLAEEGAQAARVVTWELAPQKDVSFPIEPGAEILRVVIHPFSRGNPLPTTPLVARLRVRIDGARPVDETFAVPLSTVATRVRAEDATLSVGDPSTFDVDLVGRNEGDTRITLEAADGVDGLLVRAFVREALDKAAAERRGASLDRAHARKLAESVWESDLDDLDAMEREAALTVRWRKLGLSRAGAAPRTWPLALAPRSPASTPESHGALLATVPVSGGERVAYTPLAATSVWITSDDPSRPPEVVVRRVDGTARAGAPEIDVGVAPGEVVEATCPKGATLSLRSSDPAALLPYIHTPVYRIGKSRQLRVRASTAPIVLRISARRPLPRGTGAKTRIAVSAAFVEAGRSDAIVGEVTPSVYDRYDDKAQANAPTEKVVRYALVPQGEAVELSSADDTDVALAELDPLAGPLPSKGRPVEEPPPKWSLVSDEWHGFVPRNPSNASAFVADGRVGLRIARRFVEVPPAAPHVNDYARLARVGAPGPKRPQGGRVFERAGSEWETTTRAGALAYVPLRFFTEGPARVVAEVDSGNPVRREVGVTQAFTTAHAIDLGPGESFATVVLGDDLSPGKHRFRIRVVQGGAVWFHAPWVEQKGSHWVAGDFEN
ncbi:MAG: hypothetical protein JNL38_18965 [Myxococcales bacterium]|nr:hypothetical protein [Myxococcales bacterium]